MSISSDIKELNSLKAEIKRLSGKLKTLRKREREVETNIVEYLKYKQQPGVKYDGNAVLLENKTKKKTKKKAEYQNDSIEILRRNGISNPEEVFNELLEAKIAEESEVNKLKFKKI